MLTINCAFSVKTRPILLVIDLVDLPRQTFLLSRSFVKMPIITFSLIFSSAIRDYSVIVKITF